MSSYRGEVGAWDGGPPGAEADYAPQHAPPHAAPLPTTDPWTGVSYSDYGPPHYDYQSYGYGYNYDQSYYPRTGSGYYENSSSQATQQQEAYDYQARPYEPRSQMANRDARGRHSYNSRSVSPYERRNRNYSRERENSYEESRRRRSRTTSKTKHSKYSSSSDHSSSRSRSHSRVVIKKEKRSRSQSTDSSESNRSSMKATTSKDNNSLTPPLKKRGSQCRSGSFSSCDSFKNKKVKREVESKEKAITGKDTKIKDKKGNEICTPPRRGKSSHSPRARVKTERSLTPPKRRLDDSPLKRSKYKDHKFETPPRKHRESSITPPRSYARSHSSSQSPYRSFTPQKRKSSKESHKSRSKSSSSSQSSRSSCRPRSKSPLRNRRKSLSKNQSKERYNRKSRSRSRRRSNSKYRARRSRTPEAAKSRSRSGTPSEDERRGQFTVADRKRFWKMHRSMQEKQKGDKVKSPPREMKPPPGAVESTTVDDIEYGDPPEVEGPNFADLLPPPEQALQASTSKSKIVPLPIKNDGSFLEMFKKMQEATNKDETEKKPIIKKPVLPFIGKRRGGRVLKTGLVKKAKAIDEQTVDNTPKDAWSLYMQEVKKYRETSCEEERKTRPLVK